MPPDTEPAFQADGDDRLRAVFDLQAWRPAQPANRNADSSASPPPLADQILQFSAKLIVDRCAVDGICMTE